MALIAKPTIEDIWSEGNTNGRKFKCVQALCVLSAAGATSGDIPASHFGLTKINQVTSARASDDNSVLLLPSFDGTQIYSYVAVAPSAPANLSKTIRVIVRGT